VSDSTSTGFHGYQIQPVAGIADGQIYLIGERRLARRSETILVFHEVTGAGASMVQDKFAFL